MSEWGVVFPRPGPGGLLLHWAGGEAALPCSPQERRSLGQCSGLLLTPRRGCWGLGQPCRSHQGQDDSAPWVAAALCPWECVGRQISDGQLLASPATTAMPFPYCQGGTPPQSCSGFMPESGLEPRSPGAYVSARFPRPWCRLIY